MPDELKPAEVPLTDLASLMQDVRGSLPGKCKIPMVTPFGLEAAKLFIEGKQPTEVVRVLAGFAVNFNTKTLAKFRDAVLSLPPDMKARIRQSPAIMTPAAEIPEASKSAFAVTKSMLESVVARIKDLEQEIKVAKEQKSLFAAKKEDQLMKYYDMLREVRKELERERIESEVVQAYKRAASDIGLIAMRLFTDDTQKAKFLEEVRELERRDL